MTTENPQAPESATTPENPPAPERARGRFRMSARKWLVLGLAVILLAGVGVGTWFLLKPKTTASASTTRTVQVTKGTQTKTVAFDGTLSPRKQSNVNFSVSGTVTSVKAKAGQTVKKGQTLATVDDSDLTDAVDLAEANLTTAKANLSDVYDNDGSSAAITSAKAQVSSAKAALAQANTNLDDAVLRSPISGTVASVSLEDGDTVTGSGSSGSGAGSNGSNGSTASTTSTSTAQFVVISTSTWKLEGSVGSADLAALKAGQAVTITTDATTDKLTGKVASVGIVATSTSDGAATFPIVINLAGEHKDLYSGTTASAVITTGSYPDVLTVPTAAIRTENSKTVVSKVTGTTATTTEVTIGTVFGSFTEIKSGLAEGDSVQITFTRPTSSSTSSNSGGGFGGGFGGGITDGGGPPAGAPAGGTGR